MPAPGSAPPPFRPDVEGLRAIAITAVLLAHAGVGATAGGFAGVDVFFVISGFLITQLLVRELERTGAISLTRFFAGRVKRLMPQVLAVIAAVVLASSLLLSPVRADEEQFYVVWPLLLLAFAWAARRRPASVHAPLTAVLGALAAASFAFAVHQAAVAPEQAYFSAAGRAWELALGGLLAMALLRRTPGPRASAAAAWGGIGAIVAATLLFDEDTAMPGAPALLPVLGAAALLAAGAGAAQALPTRALSTRPARFLGRISYAWYVWHWPVLVFAAAELGPLAPAEGVAVTMASLVPALLSHRFVEEPLRRSKAHLRRPRAI